MAVKHPKFDAFIAAAHAHMAKHGQKDWKLLLDQFPDIHDQSKWRWLRQARNSTPAPDVISDARDKLVAQVRRFPGTQRGSKLADKHLAPEVAQTIAADLPAAPSPAYIARSGDEGLRTIDFVAEIQSLYSDAKMLRAYAVKEKADPETGEVREAIANPAAFDKSIARRAGLLETAIRAVQEVWDLQTMQRFYETVIEEIGQESPDCQRRIMVRLAELNQRTGMTLGSMRV